uniref:Pentatricopeptide repeat-containing protein At2g33760-like n=1 Tax=Elaeis guineensis var. tenera TaxID=51953 RepID=A0A8N4F469_ELAGV|nr:pentatricopeptide repeat-containing protein At2g33760-like [Elaeis guineensis]
MLHHPCTIPDSFTFPSPLKACARLLAFSEGEALHGQTVKLGLDADLCIKTTAITMYSAFGDVNSARQVFDDMAKKKNIVWTSMIGGYARNQSPREALLLLSMMEEGLEADDATIASALLACAELEDLDHGKKLHCRIRKLGMRISVVLGTALVGRYAKCGEIAAAREVFDALPERNVLTWSAMISGRAQNDQGEEALRLFNKRVTEGDNKPNEITVMAKLSACVQTGDLSIGKWVHAYIHRTQMGYSIWIELFTY